MKVSCRRFALVVMVAATAVMIAGCPLPYEFNGTVGGSAHSTDPSTPDITAPITVSYSVQGGASGTIPDGGSFVAGQTTTVTVSTLTAGAVIFYTTDGSTLTNLRTAQKFNASSGTFTVSRTTASQSLEIHAVAVGPNMLPSTPVHVTVGVSPYPILTITVDKASVSEDGGIATFTITSSTTSSTDITVNLQTGVTGVSDLTGYETGLPVTPGTMLTAILPLGKTSVAIQVTGVHNASTLSPTVSLAVKDDTSNSPPTYSVGTPSSASFKLQDDGSFAVTYNGNGNSGGTVPTDSAYHPPGTTVTALGNTGDLVKTGYAFAGWNTLANGRGTPYAGGVTFPMPGNDIILYAAWTALPTAATPAFSVGSGTYSSGQTVTISCATSGATIRYTTDGTTPSETSGVVYSSGIPISSYTVLKAIAYASGWTDSAVATSTYTILTSLAGPWTLTNQQGTVFPGVFDMALVATDTYHFINNSGYVWSGVYQLQGSTLVMITPDNPNYTGFIWNIDSQTHLTLTNTAYAGSTAAR